MNAPLNFAVIGCGTVSGYGHLPTITALTDIAHLSAVVDINTAILDDMQERYPQASRYTDYREVMSRSDIDVVVIATHTNTHVEIAEAALNAGKHILLEKPPAPTIAEARHLLEIADKTNLIVAIGFILRYSAGFQQVKAWCDAGEIGNLRAIRLIDDWWGADHRGTYPGRGMRLLSHDGSVIVGEGVHYADLARWFTGADFADIHCLGTNLHHEYIPDHQAMICRMKNGIIVNIECSHAYGFSSKDPIMDRQVDLIGEKGVIKWNEQSGKLQLYGHSQTIETQVADSKNFESMYYDFVASIRAGRPTHSLPTLADGVFALDAVIRAHESMATGG